MSRDEKLIERLKRRPPQCDFDDIERLLAAEGWTKARQSGSHVTFTKAGAPTISVPLLSGRRVKRVYLDRILGLLGIE